MKFRPSTLLRFRSEAQMEAIKALAAKAPTSVNEWILLQLEAANLELVEGAMVQPTKKVRPKAPAKPKAEAKSVCGECGSVGGMHQRTCKDAKK